MGCCCYGVVGAIFAIITLVLAKKAMEIYNANPELYMGYQNVKIGRILAIIGLVLRVLFMLTIIGALIFYGGMEGLEEFQREMMEQQGM
ncbi:CCC motif membrane protein [Gillisia sp. JM1]|uniref:CCC motif membrane protein n=1 Tax=Gillisia sp. JM1 TaxID=1283286 RepID=UPI00293469CB|nr:CCC motif membrane protein [Gillisia sp. JM1]